MPSNPPNPLTATRYLQHSVIPVVPASLTGPCGICQDAYDAPVVLTCGHIFCRRCVTPWLEGGANTCPTCRAELFLPVIADSDEGEDVVDFFRDAVVSRVPPLLPSQATRARERRVVEETFLGGVLVARDGALSQYGCCLLIHDLWHHTARLFYSFEDFCGREIGPMEVRDMDVELLRSCIQQAIPDGARVGELEGGVLYLAAGQMLVWHSMGWGGEEWPASREFEDMVEALLEACREELGGRQT